MAGIMRGRRNIAALILGILLIGLPVGGVVGDVTGGAVAHAAAGDGLAITINGPDTVALGSTATYTVRVTNNDVQQATNLVLDVYTDYGRELTDAGPWSCAPFNGSCSLASLAPGATT